LHQYRHRAEVCSEWLYTEKQYKISKKPVKKFLDQGTSLT